MKLAVVGTGYVGLVTGACFADMGNDVWCVDTDNKKIEGLKAGDIPIFEPGLDKLVEQGCRMGNLHFTTSIEEALQHVDGCFVAVGTPMGEGGEADLSAVFTVAHAIGKHMQRHTLIVEKSTVPVGTSRKVRAIIQEELDARGSALTFDIASNPEFLKEGTAVSDCQRPDRVIIGADNDRAISFLRELYLPFVRNTENFICMDIESAEMTKYTANAMLALKISFMNEMANICERVGADVNMVRKGIGSDKRIGYSFIYAGCGYGGSCFPKDVPALIKTGQKVGYTTRILQAVEDVNEDQKKRIPQMMVEKYGEDLSSFTFAVWGLSFKPDTDDVRESAAITIIEELARRGAKLRAYDPQGIPQARDFYLKGCPGVTYCENKYEALENADALVLVTEWKEFRSPDFDRMKQLLNQPVIFDGRNQYLADSMAQRGYEYYQIGVKQK